MNYSLHSLVPTRQGEVLADRWANVGKPPAPDRSVPFFPRQHTQLTNLTSSASLFASRCYFCSLCTQLLDRLQGRFERWGRGRYGGIRYGFRRARSRLYRSQILQVNIRWKALAEIYTMHSFAPFSNLNFFVKNC